MALPHDPVSVDRFFKAQADKLGLKLLTGTAGLERIIREPTVNRPGLALAGHTQYFAPNRIQVIGSAEDAFLKSLSLKERRHRYRKLLAYKIPCLVFCRGLTPDAALLEVAERAQVPVFQCPLITMKFINLATMALEVLFAPHGIELGGMVDILGVGVIIQGESGIGKSECVLDLIERGYSLVSDDVTRVSVVEGREVIGTCPEMTKNMMEVRGIGIINVAAMFGVKSIRTEKRVDLVVTLKTWNETEDVDRLGMEEQFINILEIPVPHVVIPVRPGRNLARLVEVAAFQTKLRILGHNSARELDNRLLEKIKRSAP